MSGSEGLATDPVLKVADALTERAPAQRSRPRRVAERRGREPSESPTVERAGSPFLTGALFFVSDVIAAAFVSLALVAVLAGAPAGLLDLVPFSAETFGAATSAASLQDALTLTGLLIAALYLGGVYHQSQWEFGEGRRALFGSMIVFLGYALFAFGGPLIVAVAVAGAACAAFAGLTVFGRMVVRSISVGQSAMLRKIVVVGEGLTPEDLQRDLRTSRAMRAELVGAMTLEELLEVLEQPSSLRRLFHETKYRAQLNELTFAFASPTDDEGPKLERAVAALNQEGAAAIIAMRFPGLVGRRLRTLKVFGGDFLLAHVQPVSRGRIEQFAKRAFDIVGSVLGLIMLSPLLLTIAVALRFEGASPFFTQVRVGKDRARFRCFKFRTMVPDAEARLHSYLADNPEAQREWDLHQKLKKDPRITWMGGFLRKTSLDELPQLWNVLRGEMSIVGPRPIVAPEVPGYPQDAAYYHSDAFEGYARCRPGITGVWQVSGRSKTTHEERVRLDCWYARNWTIWLDMTIILKTVRAAVFGSSWA